MNPRLVAINGTLKGATFPLSTEETTIGRESASAVWLNHASVSRRHCLIRTENGHFKLLDLDSYNGTFVNGIPVKEQALAHADQLRIGKIELLFLIEEGEEVTSGHLIRWDDFNPLTESAKQLRPEALLRKTEQALIASPEHERTARDLGVVLRIARQINRLHHTQELVKEILDATFEIIPADRGAVVLGRGATDFSSVYGKHRDLSSYPVHISRTVVEHVMTERVAVLTNDIKTSETLKSADSLVAAQITSLMCMPLIVVDKLLGAIYLDTSDPIILFDEAHLQLVAGIAGMAAVSLENARQVEWLEDENSRLRSTLAIEHNMIGESAPAQEVYRFIQRVAPAKSAVLICGESGTGKELAAHAIHANSPRGPQPFVPINCAALPDTLLESELFGHEKGAFTGAVGRKQGKLEVAQGGTVFLDEIGEMPVTMQSRLLRFLQDHKVERLGGTRTIELDVRILAATNRDLEEMIKAGTFREDLYHRLNVVKLTMPPLRERKEDIALLASYFTAKYAKECKRPVTGITPEARVLLQSYSWPGNIRELENTIERAVVLGLSDKIGVEDLPRRMLEGEGSQEPATYDEAVKDAKRHIVLNALAQAKGNYTEAAKALGMHPNNLHRLIRTLDLKAATTR
jgi:transcriptional regulator with GAF, ATPase, and Fis domain